MLIHSHCLEEPPAASTRTAAIIRKSLFSNPFNVLLTVLITVFAVLLIVRGGQWLLFDATFIGNDRSACEQNPHGACWVFIKARFWQILLGLYYGSNPEQIWRPVLTGLVFATLLCYLSQRKTPYKWLISFFTVCIFPFAAFAVLHGGWLGLPVAPTSQWGGFLLTLVLASTGIVAALPLGICLALGRQSQLPAIRTLSVLYIEFWRGTPLITVLFMASVMIPLFLPEGVDMDKIARALIGISLFQSAYIAEVVRGGLQSVPRGQFEAADSLGMSYSQKQIFVILPQALKIAIPGIVNTFIALFKDTSLVSIIGLLDLLNMAQISSLSLAWRGYDLEAYLFAGLIFWVCCWGMSRYSQQLEKRLSTDPQSAVK